MFYRHIYLHYIDGIVKKIESAKVGCYVRQTCLGVLLYADDIVLMAPTVSALQQLLYLCESELDWLDLRINASKSAVMRIGPRYASPCCDIRRLKGLSTLVFTLIKVGRGAVH